jgi:hypothetical protein
MSTLAVTNLKHESASGNNIVLASDGTATFAEVISASKGIAFPATQVASADANTLDDYEQGTWTPSVTFGGAAAGQTGTFAGFYTKIGNQVFATCLINLSAKGSSTGVAEISGLPFASINESNYRAASSSMVWANFATNFVYIMCFMEGNYSRMTMYGITSAASANTTNVTNSNLNDSAVLRVSITYQAA